MSTTLIKREQVQRKWFLVDATGKPAGRLAVQIANILRGKVKPDFTPGADNGDFVIVINAEKVRLSGNKEEGKIYKKYSGFPSGLKLQPASEIRLKDPTRIVRQAVGGMLPRNRTRAVQLKRLKIYAGTEHPHKAQLPQTIA
jgi:large subunit ribosomal protein L13